MSKTSVPQYLPLNVILERIFIRLESLLQKANETKDIAFLERYLALGRQTYEACKLRCNDGEIPFEKMEEVRKAIEIAEKEIERYKELVGEIHSMENPLA